MDHRITTRDVAEMANVSQATVSIVLNNRPNMGIPEETRKRVIEAAIKVGYLSPDAPVFLLRPEQQDIALVIHDINLSGFTALTRSMYKRAAGNNLGVLFFDVGDFGDSERVCLQRIASRGVGGLLYMGTPFYPQMLLKLQKTMPVVVVGDTSMTPELPNFGFSSFECGELLGKYLFDLGHRKIAFVTPPLHNMSIVRSQVLSGLRKALDGSSKTCQVHVFEHTQHLQGEDTFTHPYLRIGQTQAAIIMEQHPEVTAIVATNDMLAIGVIDALKKQGLSVPGDMSVASIGNTQDSQFCNVPLTSVNVSLPQRTQFAIDHLIGLMSANICKIDTPLMADFKPSLVVRESTGKPRHTA